MRLFILAWIAGLVTAMETLPSLFFSLMAGAIADLFDKRRIAIVTQSLAAVQALALGLLVATGHASFWNIFALALFAGIVNAFDLPVRQSLIFDIVGAEDLLNASALNSVVFNIARIIGPAIAAIIIESAGEAANFFANAASYVFVVAALAAMRTEPVPIPEGAHLVLMRQALDGVAYVVRHPLFSRLFIALIVFSVFGFNYVLLMPVVVKMELHRSAGALGLLLSCLGAGALIGSLTLAGRGKTRLSSLSAMSFIFPASVIAFSLAKTLPAISADAIRRRDARARARPVQHAAHGVIAFGLAPGRRTSGAVRGFKSIGHRRGRLSRRITLAVDESRRDRPRRDAARTKHGRQVDERTQKHGRSDRGRGGLFGTDRHSSVA